MLAKARSRLWSLRKLRRSGLSQTDLLKTYKTYIRPILDYAVPTYHPQLTLALSLEIESFQADAMKIVFGPLVANHTVIEHEKIELHEIRRANLFQKFAEKAARNPSFNTKWFPHNHVHDHNLRRRNNYLELATRTERYKKSPIPAMRTLLNKIG